MSDPYYRSPAWKALRSNVLRRDPVCKTPGCGRASTHADHIQPRADGGADALWNLRGLCEGCHNSRTARGNGELRRITGCDRRGLPTDLAHPCFQSMGPALEATETAILAGQIAHGGHPILTWNARNAIVVPDPAGNRKIDKVRSTARVDGLQAMCQAIGLYARRPANTSQDWGLDLVVAI